MDDPEGENEEPARASGAAVPAGRRAASIPLPRGRQFVFVHQHQDAGGRRVAESTLGIALRNAGCTATIHGFDHAFKTWAEEQHNFPGLVIELSLAHRIGTAVENAYRRGDVIVKRRKLMETWGKRFCHVAAGGGCGQGADDARRGWSDGSEADASCDRP